MNEPTTRRPYRLERMSYRYGGGMWRCSATYTTLEAAIRSVPMRSWWRGGWRVVDARTGAVVHDASTKETR